MLLTDSKDGKKNISKSLGLFSKVHFGNPRKYLKDHKNNFHEMQNLRVFKVYQKFI